MSKVIVGLFFSFLLAILFMTTGHAYGESLSLTLAPSATAKVVKPGSTTKGSLQVSNNDSLTSYPVDLSVNSYSVKGENYIPDFTPLPHTTSIANWLTLSTNQVTLKPASSATVSYALKVPQSALPGSYFGVVFAKVQLPKVSQGVSIYERVGEIFYVTVSGPAKKTGGIYSWTSSFFQKPPLQATLKMEDTGSVLYFSNIQITVKDLFGGTKYSYSSDKVILPETIRRIATKWSGSPSFGLFKIGGTVTVFGQTKNLSTHYILIMSSKARVIFVVVVILLILLILLRYILRKLMRLGRKHKE